MIPVTPLHFSETVVHGSDMTVKSAAVKSAAVKSAAVESATLPFATVPSASARVSEVWLKEDDSAQQRNCYARNRPRLLGGNVGIA